MSYLDTKFPYYPNDIRVVKPLGLVTLREFIRAVREPKNEVKQLFIDIREASAKGDLKLKAELKKKLYYFTPCVNTNGKGRSYQDIVSFTGLMQIDFDGIPYSEEFRDKFFDTVKSCAVCGVSPSGFGIKAILRIPVVKTVDEFKSYFYGVGYYLERYKGFDIAPQNCTLPLYSFYDPNARYREDAIVSTVRGEKINAFDKEKMVDLTDYDGGEEATKNIKEKIAKYLTNKINSIDDNAYPKILSLGTVVGGWCSYYSLDLDAVVDYTNNLIDNNSYMQKSLRAYKKGFYDCMLKGMSAPWSLEESIHKE